MAAVLLCGTGCASKTTSAISTANTTNQASNSTASALTVASITADAVKTGDTGTTCPLVFDKAAVLKAAGIAGTLAPSSEPSKIASGDDGTKASPGSPMAQHGGGATITCGFEITTNGAATDVSVVLLAVNTGLAWQVMYPKLLQKSHLGENELQPMVSQGFSVGTVRLTPGAGTAALGRLAMSGGGDAALLVAVDGSGASSIAGQPLEKLTTALATTIKA